MLPLNYGDNYVKVNNGDIFAGTWDMLEDCFGITSDTINQWCQDNGYHYSVKKYDPIDELVTALWNVRRYLKEPNEFDTSGSPEYDAGIDEGMEHAAEKIGEILNRFEKANTNPLNC